MSSARAPAVKGSGHLVRKGTGGRSSVRCRINSFVSQLIALELNGTSVTAVYLCLAVESI
jgi:hypothetical protein